MSEIQHSLKYWTKLTIAAIIFVGIFFGCEFIFGLVGLVDPLKTMASMFSAFMLFFSIGVVCSKMND